MYSDYLTKNEIMKTEVNSFKADMKLLVDISCMDKSNMTLFESFHKMILAYTYNATDIEFDYKRKRIHLNILGDEIKGVYLRKFDDLSNYRMSVNLKYKSLDRFLNKCVSDYEGISRYYPNLKYSFFKSRATHLKNTAILEEV